jgi:DNA-directed RNA polymerase subunit E'/Rpb7
MKVIRITYIQMIKRTTLARTICIEPHLLDSSIHQHIIAKAREAWEGKCTKDDGFITKVHGVSRIVDNYVSPATSGLIFELVLDVETMKPRVGDVFEKQIVAQIIPQGVFTTGDVVVFVPIMEFEGFGFSNGELIHEDGRKIVKDSIIKVEITATKYDRNNFKYIGCLKE